MTARLGTLGDGSVAQWMMGDDGGCVPSVEPRVVEGDDVNRVHGEGEDMNTVLMMTMTMMMMTTMMMIEA